MAAFSSVLASLSILILLSCLATPASTQLSDEGKVLMNLKASFSNAATELLGWGPVSSDPENDAHVHCKWRGVVCDNLTTVVVSLNLSNLNIGGKISPAIGNLKSVQIIDLKGNRLSGQIPDEIGDCVALTYLDFSGNLLYGDIPFSISKLKSLEELILNNNNLDGEIPVELSNCCSLTSLNLSYNNFSGHVPSAKNFSRFPPESFLGNPMLYGSAHTPSGRYGWADRSNPKIVLDSARNMAEPDPTCPLFRLDGYNEPHVIFLSRQPKDVCIEVHNIIPCKESDSTERLMNREVAGGSRVQ